MVGRPHPDRGGDRNYLQNSTTSKRKFRYLALGIYFPAPRRRGNCRRALRDGEARRAQGILRLLRVLDGDAGQRGLRPISPGSPGAQSRLFTDCCKRQGRRLRPENWRHVVDNCDPARGRILHLRLPLLYRQSRGCQGPALSLSNGRNVLDENTFLYKNYTCVYAQELMGPKLLIAILVLALSGANSDLASMCAAYCMSSASLHHHMESQQGSTSASHHFHSYHNAANCAECPPDSANSLNEKDD